MTTLMTSSQQRSGAVAWARTNLFATWYDTVLTFVLGLPLLYAAFRLLRFVFVRARWDAVEVNLTLIAVGRYPRAEVWRTFVVAVLLLGLLSLALGAVGRLLESTDPEAAAIRERGILATIRRFWPLLLLVAVFMGLSRQPVTIAALLALVASAPIFYQVGRRLPLGLARRAWLLPGAGVIVGFVLLTDFGRIGLQLFGGLMLTLFLAISAIVLSFPIGVLAALGRRSSLPAMRIVSIGYIELIRGVPLITILFMGNFALEFFLPGHLVPGRITRAIIALTIFTAAYVAEDVRGGLQSVPRGQIEAAQALGLRPITVLRRIVLPQALRNVIPALVGEFISLFKDTSLVFIIALTDLLLVLRRIIPGQPAFAGTGVFVETLVFAAFIYWCFAFTMLRESQRLERRLGVGQR
jgi:general L-amino acid transport system permease protein